MRGNSHLATFRHFPQFRRHFCREMKVSERRPPHSTLGSPTICRFFASRFVCAALRFRMKPPRFFLVSGVSFPFNLAANKDATQFRLQGVGLPHVVVLQRSSRASGHNQNEKGPKRENGKTRRQVEIFDVAILSGSLSFFFCSY